MVTVNTLIGYIARGHVSKPKHFFHFTSVANLPSIRERGLLSQRRIVELGLADVDYASDSTSRDSDKRNKIDDFVHLCFFDEHPMTHVAGNRCRSGEIRFVRVSPTVLRLPGVLLSMGAANRNDVVIDEVQPMLAKIDLQVIYAYNDWRDPDVQTRLSTARMYEILVPQMIAREYLLIPDG